MTSAHKCHHHNYVKNSVLWDITPWSWVINYRPFGGACRFYFKVDFCHIAATPIQCQ